MSESLEHRRSLHTDATLAEAFLWNRLRDRRLEGFKLRRQHPLGPYILDLFCPRRLLAIELDGGQHFEIEAQAYDGRRSDFLCRHGVSILRFRNDQVFLETEAVLELIRRALRTDPSL